MKKILYHVSTDVGHTGVFVPRVPEYRMDDEDAVTPRICFSETLEGCLGALGGFYGRTNLRVFWLEVDMDDPDVLWSEDLVCSVPDALIHKECWVKRLVKLEDYADIRLTHLCFNYYCLLKAGTGQPYTFLDGNSYESRYYHSPKYYYLSNSASLPTDIN